MSKGHGRLETRKISVSGVKSGYLDFPHANQVFQIERITVKKGGVQSREFAYGITSLTERKVSAARLLELVRKHWGIENRLHWVRDVTFDEDRSQVRKGAAAQSMAALRNMAIGLLRLAGARNIAAALRDCQAATHKALRLIGIQLAC